MILTVAIPTKNRYEKIKHLLDSLNFQSFKKFKILIIDASDRIKDLAAIYPQLNINQIPFNEGNLPFQRWYAILQCQTKYLGFLDDDVTFNENFIEQLILALENSDENIAGISGWIENTPKSRTNWKKKVRRKLAGIGVNGEGNISPGGFANPINRTPTPAIARYLQGPCMFFKSDLVKSHGYLPWLYELYRQHHGRGEDIALSGYISRLGYRFEIFPDIVCYHHFKNGGSPIAKKGIDKGIADSYGRYLVAKNISTTWTLMNRFAFLRYFLITFVCFNPAIFFDINYLKGIFKGCCKILYK